MIKKMEGRFVEMFVLQGYKPPCGDCEQPAKFVVIEQRYCGPPDDCVIQQAWFWCGNCHIGG